jgi:Calcineurin-like phosphoesterase
LKQVSYNKEKDTLIHLGDVVTKGSHEGSLLVLSFLSSNNITGVRGNNDQKVIEWRAWFEWIGGLEAGAGSRWLLDLEEKWEEGNLDGELENNSDTEVWVEAQRGKGIKDHKWWSKVPKGWKLFSDHYRIARYVPLPRLLVIGNVLTRGKERCQRETTNICSLCH